MQIFLNLFFLMACLIAQISLADSDMLNNLLRQNWGSGTDRQDPAWQFQQGKMYDRGDGVEQDKEKALSWYQKSAEQGYAEAQLLLGIMYDQGIGVEQDYAQAIDWYRQAAEQGYAKAQFNLAGMYDEGLGVEKDYRQAADWYRKAAELGFAKAQFNLGTQYFKGEGVEKNPAIGAMWLQLAAAQGLEKEVKNFMQQEPAMSNTEIKKAKKMLNDWRSRHKKLTIESHADSQ